MDACDSAKFKNEKGTRSSTRNFQAEEVKYDLSLPDFDADTRGVICHNPVRIDDIDVHASKWKP
jgi:predicted neutral ceramidase superfamily lipid hydrolase